MKRLFIFIFVLTLFCKTVFSQDHSSDENSILFKQLNFDTLISKRNKISLYTGFGLGVSYGIFGIRAQGRIMNDRIGGFIGMGHWFWLNDKPSVLFSGGIKFFPYKNIYLSAQYSCVDIVSKVKINDDSNVSKYYSPVYSFTSLIGGDFELWKNLGFNLAVGCAYLKERHKKVYFVMDAGVFWKF